ncbi:LOW QUALITY PROTEIN: hypothetical protein JCM19037_2651 [Geomicrobium sp. JCM 19037]|nr:LOW QUALITY PROTEIN: hypothetical protein JCM19037_2651 [Geomicrobium sp. JCM 19037]
MKPQKSKRGGPLPFRYVFLISLAIFLVMTIHGLYFVDQHIRPSLMSIAVVETKRIAQHAVTEAISQEMTDGEDMDDLVLIERSENGDISSLAFNAQVYNRVLSDATMVVQDYLQEVQRGITQGDMPRELEEEFEDTGVGNVEDGAIYTIPLGMATGNALLANLGLRVPVSFSVIGEIHADMEEQIENVGINNTWLRISVAIDMDVRVVIPFGTEEDHVQYSVPVGMVFVPGDVPDYYGQGGGMPVPAIMPSGEEESVEMQGPETPTEEGNNNDVSN